MASRHLVLEELGDALAAVRASDRLTRIGIDGVDGAGKTSLAKEVAQLLTKRSRPCVRVSLDFFERSPAERYARGELSPEGYYLDGFDVERLRAHILSIGGPPELVVVVDGIFLQRPELADLWDAAVWVEADLDVAAERALPRLDSIDAELERYCFRYLPAQRRYIEEQRPYERAEYVLRNTELDEPELVRLPRPR